MICCTASQKWAHRECAGFCDNDYCFLCLDHLGQKTRYSEFVTWLCLKKFLLRTKTGALVLSVPDMC